MVCIYKITSPSGKIYIGQTWNLVKRLTRYYNIKSCRQQPGIYRSLKKYGYENHRVEILHELPKDINQTTLDSYEQFYIAQHKNCGLVLLNMTEGGSGGKMFQEAIEKIKHKRKSQAPPTLGHKRTEESNARMSKLMKGRKMPAEVVQKVAAKLRGRPLSEATKKKLREAKARHNHWIGKKHTEESKQKQSAKKLGNMINAKRVRRVDTGEIFESGIEAAKSIGITKHAFWARMNTGYGKGPKFIYLPNSFTTS